MLVIHESNELSSPLVRKSRTTPKSARCSTESDNLHSRYRWDGPLSKAQLAQARKEGVWLCYDPAQHGWLLSTAQGADEDPDPPIWACLVPFVLRPWEGKDLDQFLALLDNPELWKYLVEDMPKPLTRTVAADLLSISNYGTHHEVQAISTILGPVGQVRMLWSGPGLQVGEAEISYWLGQQYRGRGWATHAIKQTLRGAFRSRPGLRRVVAYVHPENTDSARVLKRVGFESADIRPSDGWLGFSFSRVSV